MWALGTSPEVPQSHTMSQHIAEGTLQLQKSNTLFTGQLFNVFATGMEWKFVDNKY